MSRRRSLRRALTILAPASAMLHADQRERDGRSRLTQREREVLDLVAEGMTNAQIGAALWISGGTVRRHLENVYGKAGRPHPDGRGASRATLTTTERGVRGAARRRLHRAQRTSTATRWTALFS